jgi:hypothetical protein
MTVVMAAFSHLCILCALCGEEFFSEVQFKAGAAVAFSNP